MKILVLFLYLTLIFLCVDCIKGTNKRRNKQPSERKNKMLPTKAPPVPKPVSIFKTTNNTVAKGQFGSTTVLHCQVLDNEANITVEWYKEGMEEVLTINDKTPGDDKRFLAKKYDEDTNHWMLKIRYTKETDNGTYRCIVTGELNSTLITRVVVIRAFATILHENPRYLRVGYPLRLSCELHNSIKPPTYIFWYKNDAVINYDLKDGATVREGRRGSELIFPRAAKVDAGNYSCVPSNADQASVIVEYRTVKQGAAIELPDDE